MAILFEELTKEEQKILIDENIEWWKWKELCDWQYNLFCEESGNKTLVLI